MRPPLGTGTGVGFWRVTKAAVSAVVRAGTRSPGWLAEAAMELTGSTMGELNPSSHPLGKVAASVPSQDWRLDLEYQFVQ